MVLVAGLMPEEVSDEPTADRLARVQEQLLTALAAEFPEALFYSNFFRWGLLDEEEEEAQLAAAASSAAASGDLTELQRLAMLLPYELASQLRYELSAARSTGWQWHPASCAAFGWLNRMQAALCGTTDDLLVRSAPAGVQLPVAPWLEVAVFLLERSLAALGRCTALLRRYSGCAGRPDKAADSCLLEALRDLAENFADACQGVACLVALRDEQQQQHGEPPAGAARSIDSQPAVQPAAADSEAQGGAAAPPQPPSQPPAGSALEQRDGPTADMPAAAPSTAHTVHLAAAVSRAAASSGTPTAGRLTQRAWLVPLLAFMDAIIVFFGEDSADVPATCASHFVAAAATFTLAARREGLADALEQKQLLCGRLQGLSGSEAWLSAGPGLQQMIQMPGSRKRKQRS